MYKRFTKIKEENGKKIYVCDLLKQELIDALGRAEDIIAPIITPKYHKHAYVYTINPVDMSIDKQEIVDIDTSKGYAVYSFGRGKKSHKEDELYVSRDSARRALSKIKKENQQKFMALSLGLPVEQNGYKLYVQGIDLISTDRKKVYSMYKDFNFKKYQLVIYKKDNEILDTIGLIDENQQCFVLAPNTVGRPAKDSRLIQLTGAIY